jgi:hypothetical protein
MKRHHILGCNTRPFPHERGKSKGIWPKVLSAAAVVFGRDVCFAVTDKTAFL